MPERLAGFSKRLDELEQNVKALREDILRIETADEIAKGVAKELKRRGEFRWSISARLLAFALIALNIYAAVKR